MHGVLQEGERERVIANVQRIATRLSHRMGADLSASNWLIPSHKKT